MQVAENQEKEKEKPYSFYQNSAGSRDGDSSKPLCYRCDKCHIARDCPQRKTDPPGKVRWFTDRSWGAEGRCGVPDS